MEDLAFAALTLGAILANSIGQEPEIWEAARPREGERGTWVLSLPPAGLAWRQRALGLCPPLLWAHSLSPHLGQVVRGAFREAGRPLG